MASREPKDAKDKFPPLSQHMSSPSDLEHDRLDFASECGGLSSNSEFIEPSVKRQRMEAAQELSMPSASYSSFTSLEDGEIIDSTMDPPFDTHESVNSFSYEDMFAYDDEDVPKLKIIGDNDDSFDFNDHVMEDVLIDNDSYEPVSHLSQQDIEVQDYDNFEGCLGPTDSNSLPAMESLTSDSRASDGSSKAEVSGNAKKKTTENSSSTHKKNLSRAKGSSEEKPKSEYDEEEEEEEEEEEDFDLDADELDNMLEEGMGYEKPKKKGTEEDDSSAPLERQKIVLVEKKKNPFDILPEGWVIVTHNSGMPVYLHRLSRVCTLSRPYFLGPGSTRKHNIPISAIPCYQYRKALEWEGQTQGNSAEQPSQCPVAAPPSDSTNAIVAKPPTALSEPDQQPSQTASQPDATQSSEPSAEDSSTSKDGASKTEGTPQATPAMPSEQQGCIVETAEALEKENNLNPDQVREYCSSLFLFKTLTIKKFKTWKARRNHIVKLRKASRPTLPSNTKLITFPMRSDKDCMLNRKKEFIFNPAGKSEICILHEYAQHALRVQPKYIFKELENGKTPYGAAVLINDVQYGWGYASSKKAAKLEAAKASLKILIPDLYNNADDKSDPAKDEPKSDKPADKKKAAVEDKSATPPGAGNVPAEFGSADISFFDEIKIEDPRVTDLSNKVGQPSPYQVLGDCLKRNYGLGNTDIHVEMRALKHQRSEYIMRVGKHEAKITCKNKREGKHLASQCILQKLHPHIKSWGSLLRLYNWKEVFQEKKAEKQTVSELQSGSNPNRAILTKLKAEMYKLHQRQKDGDQILDGRPQFLPKDVKTADLMSIDL